MKHTRVPRTVRRDIWRLAMETLSITSLRIFWSRIRNKIKSRIENRKKTNDRTDLIYIPCATLDYYRSRLLGSWLLLGLIDVVQCLHKLRTLAAYKKASRGNSMSRFCYFRPKESALCKNCTSINQPYLIWAAVHCHVPPPKDQGDWHPQSQKGVDSGKKRSRRSPWWR